MKAFGIPFIKFPQDWEIKFILMGSTPHDQSELRFFVKKNGAPNIVCVSLFNIARDKPYWEVLVVSYDDNEDLEPHYYYRTICDIDYDSNQIDRLIGTIEEQLYTEGYIDEVEPFYEEWLEELDDEN